MISKLYCTIRPVLIVLLQGWKVARWKTEKVSKKIGKNPKSCHLNFKSCYLNFIILSCERQLKVRFSLFTITANIGQEK